MILETLSPNMIATSAHALQDAQDSHDAGMLQRLHSTEVEKFRTHTYSWEAEVFVEASGYV